MARKPMRSQLNQVRAWLRQGRTDAWIAHQLDVSASELRDFIRRNNLSGEGDEGGDVDLRDEIEAEIEATMESEDEEEDDEEADDEDDEEAEAEPEADDEGDEDEGDDAEEDGESEERPRSRGRGGRGGRERERVDADAEGGDGQGRRRRRRRRRGPKRAGAGLEATFDHGEEGYGLWLDPAVAGDPVYSEHWKGHRPVEVTIEPDQIIIRRSGD